MALEAGKRSIKVSVFILGYKHTKVPGSVELPGTKEDEDLYTIGIMVKEPYKLSIEL